MIGRIGERAAFERLAQQGSRARAGALWCTFVHDPSLSSPRVAFSIGRAVGPAVTRNRVRRRLRAILASQHELLPAGLYLIGARPAAAQRSFIELQFDLKQLISKVARPRVPDAG